MSWKQEERKPGWAAEKLQKIQKLRDFYAEEHAQQLAQKEAAETEPEGFYLSPAEELGAGSYLAQGNNLNF